MEGILASPNEEDDEPIIKDHYMDDDAEIHGNIGSLIKEDLNDQQMK